MKSLLVEIILVIPHYQTTGYPTTSECGITESNIFTESTVLTSCQSMDQQSLNKTMNEHWHQATLRSSACRKPVS